MSNELKKILNNMTELKNRIKKYQDKIEEDKSAIMKCKAELIKLFYEKSIYLPMNKLKEYANSKFLEVHLIYKDENNKEQLYYICDDDHIKINPKTGHFETFPTYSGSYKLVYDSKLKAYKEINAEDKNNSYARIINFIGFYEVSVNGKLIKNTTMLELAKAYRRK